jgi:hypothetical protein
MNDPNADFIVTMVFRNKHLGEWSGAQQPVCFPLHMGTTIPIKVITMERTALTFKGTICAADDCDRMEAKR